MSNSDKLTLKLIETLEREVKEAQSQIDNLTFALAVKKSKLERLKHDYQGHQTPISQDKPT